ncbi:type II secretion system protein [Kiritimatiellaeota bacterium B1221]|nr:type II secretion system protein [Kiritimatiellaeota bacterium B1221]
MKEQKPTQSGFTLIEMLVVIAIIVLLASLLFPAINSAINRAQQTKCMSNLRNFGIAWNTNYLSVKSGRYNDETDAIFPWLSAMVPEFANATNLVCPGDSSHGTYGSKPDESPNYNDQNAFEETDDMTGNNHPDRNTEIDACSYMYEFCAAECSWFSGSVDEADLNDDGQVSWAEAKLRQLSGDSYSPDGYDPSKFPLVRCFHHYDDKKVRVDNLDDNKIVSEIRVLNVAMDGHIFLSGPQWEYPLAP